MSAPDTELLQALEAIYAGDPNLRPIDAAAMIVARRIAELGADAAYVATVSADGGAIEVARVAPDSSTPVRLAFPVDAPYPLAATIRRREALYIADNNALECDHPGLMRIRNTDHACATLPLFAPGGELLGAVNVSFEDPRDFGEDERATIEELAAQCAAAMAAPRRARERR